MNARPYLVLSGCVFAVVGALHVWRALAALPVSVGQTSVAPGLSWLAAVGAVVLSLWAFRLASKS